MHSRPPGRPALPAEQDGLHSGQASHSVRPQASPCQASYGFQPVEPHHVRLRRVHKRWHCTTSVTLAQETRRLSRPQSARGRREAARLLQDVPGGLLWAAEAFPAGLPAARSLGKAGSHLGAQGALAWGRGRDRASSRSGHCGACWAATSKPGS